jgi:hypothetical protein
MATAYTEIDLLTILNEVFVFQCDSIAPWTFFRTPLTVKAIGPRSGA